MRSVRTASGTVTGCFPARGPQPREIAHGHTDIERRRGGLDLVRRGVGRERTLRRTHPHRKLMNGDDDVLTVRSLRGSLERFIDRAAPSEAWRSRAESTMALTAVSVGLSSRALSRDVLSEQPREPDTAGQQRFERPDSLLLLDDDRRVRHSEVVVDDARSGGIGDPDAVVDDEGIAMMADRHRRGHRPHAAAAMLRLIAGVVGVPSVEVADDRDLFGVRRDENELNALRRLWRGALGKERGDHGLRRDLDVVERARGADAPRTARRDAASSPHDSGVTVTVLGVVSRDHNLKRE